MTADSSPGIVSVERITPEAAREMLARNQRNRNLRVVRVRELSGAMQRGEWQLTGETIKLAKGGALLDGQHRLEAVVHSGVTIESVVVRDLPLNAQDTIDTGRRRRLADVLALEGYPNAVALAATLNVVHRRRNGHRITNSRNTAPTPQQALALLAQNRGLHESVEVARRVTKAIGGPTGVYAALHHEFGEIDPPATEEFFAGLEEGAELSRSDPVLHLRNHLVRPRSDRTYKLNPPRVAALVIKAFALRRAGRTIASLLSASEEGLPMPVRQEGAT